MNVDLGKFRFEMREQIEIPLFREFRMMPALHQNLNSAHCRKFVEFLIDLLE